MANLTSNVLPEGVTPEWLAKTYSEYLYACADDQLDMNNAISNASDDDTLQTIIEGYREVWDQNIDKINDSITAFCIAKGLARQDFTNRTQAFKDAMDDFTPTEAFEANVTAIRNKFSGEWESNEDFVSNYVDGYIDTESIIAGRSNVQNRISALVDDISSSLSLADDYSYGLADGFVNFKDLCKNLIKFANLEGACDEFKMSAVDSGDGALGEVTCVASAVIDELKSTAAANIAWAQGFASCAIDNVADRIANYTETIKASFSSAYTEAKETFNNVRAFLSSTSCNVRTFISTAERALGITDLVDSNKVVGQTDVASYTGASPYAGMNLHTAKGIVTVTVRTVCAAGLAVWNGIKKIGSKIWGKIRPFVKAITTDPEDIKVINDKADSYQIENWAYQCSSARVNIPFTDVSTREKIRKLINDKYLNKAIAMDNYFSTVIFTITGANAAYYSNTNWISIIYSYKLKPKCVNTKNLVDAALITKSATTYSPAPYVIPSDVVTSLKEFSASGQMYLDDDATENAKATAFMNSIQATFTYMMAALHELADQNSTWGSGIKNFVDVLGADDSMRLNYYGSADAWESYLFRTNHNVAGVYTIVTNKDFLKFSSGYKEDNEDFTTPGSTPAATWVPQDNMGQFQMFHGVENDDMAFLVCTFITLFVIQINDRYHNPGDFLFLPFTSDTFDFAQPRYAIKTDAENANIADIFVSALVIVAVIAVAVLIGAKVCRSITKAKFKKWTAIKGRLDNKIWQNTEPMTKSDWRRYLRADRKLSKINLWSKGQAISNIISANEPSGVIGSLLSANDTSSPVSYDDYTYDQISYIRALISG